MPSPRLTNPSQKSDYETLFRVSCAAYSCCLHHREMKETRSEYKEENIVDSWKNQNKGTPSSDWNSLMTVHSQTLLTMKRISHVDLTMIRPPEKWCQVDEDDDAYAKKTRFENICKVFSIISCIVHYDIVSFKTLFN